MQPSGPPPKDPLSCRPGRQTALLALSCQQGCPQSSQALVLPAPMAGGPGPTSTEASPGPGNQVPIQVFSTKMRAPLLTQNPLHQLCVLITKPKVCLGWEGPSALCQPRAWQTLRCAAAWVRTSWSSRPPHLTSERRVQSKSTSAALFLPALLGHHLHLSPWPSAGHRGNTRDPVMPPTPGLWALTVCVCPQAGFRTKPKPRSRCFASTGVGLTGFLAVPRPSPVTDRECIIFVQLSPPHQVECQAHVVARSTSRACPATLEDSGSIAGFTAYTGDPQSSGSPRGVQASTHCPASAPPGSSRTTARSAARPWHW